MTTITPTVTLFDKTPAILVTFAGFNTNGDDGSFDSWKTSNFYGNLYRGATAIITRTAGTGTAIDVDVNVSLDNSKQEASNINNMTAVDTYAHEVPVGDNAEIPWRFWHVDIVAVGTGNTLTLELWLYK